MRARLGRHRWARVGKALAWALTGGLAAMAVGERMSEGADVSLRGLVVLAAHGVPWLVGAPIALAAAEDHAAADRHDGILALAASRGVSPSGLGAARVLAAMEEIAWGIGAPLATLALLTAALAGRVPAVLDRVGLALGVAAFAMVAGVVLGGLGAACGRLGGARGRWLLLAIVVGPWMLADLAGRGAWSIPGALGVALDLVLGGRGA
jgi:hypothetical protein